MAEPKIAQKRPYVQQVEPGNYWWCACGNSSDQPFCDGSHRGTGISPVKVVIEESTRVVLCGCKHSANGAYCDGTHSSL